MALRTKNAVSSENTRIDSDEAMISDTTPKSRKKLIIIVVAALALICIGWYIYSQTDGYKKSKAEAAVREVIEDISDHMIIPEGETPVVFDIEDPQLLVSQQPFFTGAEKGDKLVIFSNQSKAIIYSPDRDIIVNVGPVTFDQNQINQGSSVKSTR